MQDLRRYVDAGCIINSKTILENDNIVKNDKNIKEFYLEFGHRMILSNDIVLSKYLTDEDVKWLLNFESTTNFDLTRVFEHKNPDEMRSFVDSIAPNESHIVLVCSQYPKFREYFTYMIDCGTVKVTKYNGVVIDCDKIHHHFLTFCDMDAAFIATASSIPNFRIHHFTPEQINFLVENGVVCGNKLLPNITSYADYKKLSPESRVLFNFISPPKTDVNCPLEFLIHTNTPNIANNVNITKEFVEKQRYAKSRLCNIYLLCDLYTIRDLIELVWCEK